MAADDKMTLRKHFLAERQTLSSDVHRYAVLADLACSHIQSLPEWRLAHTVGLYCAFRGEVDTTMLFQEAQAEQKTVVYPRCVKDSDGAPSLEWHTVSSLSDLKPGAYGILEPDPQICPIRHSPVDFLIVPAVALDRCGNRLGYGAGYYDRQLALSSWKGVVTAGLVFQCQVAQALPHGGLDIRLSYVVTEKGAVRVV